MTTVGELQLHRTQDDPREASLSTSFFLLLLVLSWNTNTHVSTCKVHFPLLSFFRARLKGNWHSTIASFRHPERVAIVVSGASQDEVKPILEHIFREMPPFENPKEEVSSEKAVYTGGSAMIYNEEPPPTSDEKFQACSVWLLFDR